jgi:hypothetical protein
MPNIHQEECEEHGRRIEDVDEEFVVIDVDVHFSALGGGEFDDTEDNSVLRTKSLHAREVIWKVV